MVYLGNILSEFRNMGENEELQLNFRSGKSSTLQTNDVLETVRGDLKIFRKIGENKRRVIFVDSAEIESFNISEKW